MNLIRHGYLYRVARAMRVSAILGAAILFCGSGIGGENLLPNGTLDDGQDFATHWERPNGLTVKFTTEKGRGRVVLMDTQVARKQVLAWLATFAENPDAPVPEKRRLAKSSYGTVGAFEGVALDSMLIDVVPGQNYKLCADVKGDGVPFIWIKAFMQHPRRDMLVDAYQTRLAPKTVSPIQWHTCCIGFNPTARTPKVTKMKVRLYAYWPNGIYYFDNVRIEAITQEEMDALVAQRAEK